MTFAWRLDKAKRGQRESFSGDGAQISGGRWNHRGVRAVYASQSLALAALEKFVHTQSEGWHVALVVYQIEIPGTVETDRRETQDLPPNWREEPAPKETKDAGTAWLRKNCAAVLRVPSIIIPGEYNFVLNPVHPHFRRIKILSREPFGFDPRMWKA